MEEAFAVLLILGLVVVVFVLPIAAFVRSGRAAREAEQFRVRLTTLEFELARLKKAQEQKPTALKPSVEQQSAAHSSRPEPSPAEQPVAGPPGEVRGRP